MAHRDSPSQLYTLPELSARTLETSFPSLLVGEVLFHKVAGFADHFDAKIKRVTQDTIVLEIGRRGIFRRFHRGPNFPLQLTLQFEPHACDGVVSVSTRLTPLAWQVPFAECRTRYVEVVRELHAYLMRHEMPLAA